MDLDFTFSKFRELCEVLPHSGYDLLTIKEYLSTNKKPKNFIILRHDVDVKPQRALKMAKIEREFNISSTYYFRMTDEVFQPRIIKSISEMGHEIGYHYEVLDKAKGDKVKGMEIFKNELNMLRNICPIETICMHGNSRTKWDNKTVWNDYDFMSYDILGEAYLSIDSKDMLYLSETGRNWGSKYKVKDIASCSRYKELLLKIKTTDDVIRLIREKKIEHIYVLSHPRWTDNFIEWLEELILTDIKNIAKIGLIQWRRAMRLE